MSSLNFLVQLPGNNFECSICQDVFTDPVTTPCGHNFCRSCLVHVWDEGELCHCPACNKRFFVRPEISTNVAMEEISVQIKRRKISTSGSLAAPGVVACDVCMEKKLKAMKSCLVCLTSYCEAHLEPHQRVPSLMRHRLMDPVENLEKRVCEKHERLLELFCKDDQVCVCLLCSEGQHQYHEMVSVEQEGAKQRDSITSRMANIKVMIEERMEKMTELEAGSKKAKERGNGGVEHSDRLYSALMKHVRESHTKLRQNILEEFRKSEQRDEEMMTELQEEVTRLKEMNSKLKKLSQSEDHLHLLQTLQDLSPPSFSQNWCEVQADTDLCVQPARWAVSRLIDSFQAELRTLTETELTWMRRYKEAVAFDSDTAGDNLVVMHSGNCLKHVKVMSPKVNNVFQRFDGPMVLGTKGFTSGRHYWEVQVGLMTDWDVGVAKETIPRVGRFLVMRAEGFFVIGKRSVDYLVHGSPQKTLHLSPKPKHVGVYLDCNQGRVSFYDVDRKLHIHSFTEESFTEKLYPFFYLHSWAKKSKPLIINPLF